VRSLAAGSCRFRLPESRRLGANDLPRSGFRGITRRMTFKFAA
jgi:hypothetical protein